MGWVVGWEDFIISSIIELYIDSQTIDYLSIHNLLSPTIHKWNKPLKISHPLLVCLTIIIAGSIAAFSTCCCSMDAFPKTFYFEETLHRGKYIWLLLLSHPSQ